jgi:deazaflavin-dependent oxidoreductase (nitroreductase family)
MPKSYQPNPNVNWLTSFMARRGWGRTEVLTCTGRKTGQRRQVPVSPIEIDGSQYVVAPYGTVSWVCNVRADPKVTLRHGSEEREVLLEEVSGEQAAEAVAAYYARESFPRQYMDLPENPSVADFAARSGQFPVFRIQAKA